MVEQLTGRDLDAEIERQVFGQEVHLVEVQPGRKVWRIYCGIYTDGEPRYRPLLAYSGQIDYAWLVVERMRELGLEVQFVTEMAVLELPANDYPDHLSYDSLGELAPLAHFLFMTNTAEAICRAALAAVA